jgi:hypothetical protein
MKVLRQAREVQTGVPSQYVAAACREKEMYLESDRNVCICASSTESDVRNENFKDNMKESEEYFIRWPACLEPAPLPHSRYEGPAYR